MKVGKVSTNTTTYDEEEEVAAGDGRKKQIVIIAVFSLIILALIATAIWGWGYLRARDVDTLAQEQSTSAEESLKEEKKQLKKEKSKTVVSDKHTDGLPDVDADKATAKVNDDSVISKMRAEVGAAGDTSLFKPSDYDNYNANMLFVAYGLADEGSAVGAGTTIKVSGDYAIVGYPNGYSVIFSISQDRIVDFRSSGEVFDSGVSGKMKELLGSNAKYITVYGNETLLIDSTKEQSIQEAFK